MTERNIYYNKYKKYKSKYTEAQQHGGGNIKILYFNSDYSYDFDGTLDSTLFQYKQAVSAVLKMPFDDISVICSGTILHDNTATLRSYGLSEKDIGLHTFVIRSNDSTYKPPLPPQSYPIVINETYTFDGPINSTLREFVNYINTQTGIPIDRIAIMYSGREITEYEKTFEQHNIEPTTNIRVRIIPPQPAQPPQPPQPAPPAPSVQPTGPSHDHIYINIMDGRRTRFDGTFDSTLYEYKRQSSIFLNTSIDKIKVIFKGNYLQGDDKSLRKLCVPGPYNTQSLRVIVSE